MTAVDDLSIGVLSFGAHRTLEHALTSHKAAGLDHATDDFFIHFNAMTEADAALAARFGVRASGSAANTGIYGGFRAIVEAARHPYVLVLENDIVSVTSPQATHDALASAVADMKAYGLKAFSMRSRAEPGQGIEVAIEKYARCFAIRDPLRDDLKQVRPSLLSRAVMAVKYLDFDSFVGAAFFIERDPDQVHPRAIRKLASGNFATTSRFRKWSNQSVLVERQFFLDVICARVEARPDRRLVHGHQDIERAIVGGRIGLGWWQRLGVPMGQAGTGCFSHSRLDR